MLAVRTVHAAGAPTDPAAERQAVRLVTELFLAPLLLLALASTEKHSPFLAGDLLELPDLAQLLAVWAPDSVALAPELFLWESSTPLRDAKHRTYDKSSLEEWSQLPGWVMSPDSLHAVWVSIEKKEPDSEVQLLDLDTDGFTVVLTCGTNCDFDMAWWLDSDVVLIAGVNWDRLVPLLYRLDVSKRVLECFRGPGLNPDRASSQREAIQALRGERLRSQN